MKKNYNFCGSSKNKVKYVVIIKENRFAGVSETERVIGFKKKKDVMDFIKENSPMYVPHLKILAIYKTETSKWGDKYLED